MLRSDARAHASTRALADRLHIHTPPFIQVHVLTILGSHGLPSCRFVMSQVSGGKVPSYHAPPFDSPLSGATIHELRCLDTKVQLGFHLVPHIAKTLITELPSSAYVLVTDTNLAKLGAIDKFRKAFEAIPGARLLVYELAPGEESKSRETKAAIEDWMLEHRLTRDTVVLACGGGVIGDLVGFVAATFMRGLKYVQIPTTLLAMVDSSVGGKTAIDHPHGKNLIGAFHQPRYVFIDAAWLLTLPEREFSNGMAEVIKTAAIWDAADFEKLESESASIRAAVMGDEARQQSAAQGHTLATRTSSQSLLLDVIRGSVGVKAHIVTIDEKETGLRNLVNFGHSVGHAIEAVLTPDILHGECVAVGMVLEAEIARLVHGLPQVAIGRLVRCLRLYNLPVTLADARIMALSKVRELTTARVLDIMRVDKKNAGAQKKIVLLSRIGATVEERASTVSDAMIERVLAPAMLVRESVSAPRPPLTIHTPGSKSVSNRALVLAALSGGTCRLRHLLHSDDTQVMMQALAQLRAADFAWEDNGATLVVHGHGGRVLASDEPVYLQNAGTAARFVTAVACLASSASCSGSDESSCHGVVHLTGNARMKQRPIGPLVDALRSNGARIDYVEQSNCLPLNVTASGALQGGRIELAADVSSQYVSAVLLCAPYAQNDVELALVGGKVISQPYIDMTIAMMQSFGVRVERVAEHVYRIPRTTYVAPSTYEVECDASSATYPLAIAAITGTTVTVPSLGRASLQGDAAFARNVLAPMGCQVEQNDVSTTVTGPPVGMLKALGTIDMESMTDAFITAAMLFAVATAPCDEYASSSTSASPLSTRITGIANQRVKECDRLRAVVTELAKLGVRAVEHDDGIEVFSTPISQLLPHASIYCYDDHRIAMAFSVLACVVPGAGTEIQEKRCVEKTWPSWWDVLGGPLNVPIAGARLNDALVSLVARSRQRGPPTPTTLYGRDASIVLIGMRASGKSHVGRSLAKLMHRTFVDADVVFSDMYDIGAFVQDHGWDAFRAEESRILESLLTQCSVGHVIALGGGVIESAASRALLARFREHVGPVVHIVRDFALIESFLATSDRPAYGEPLADVYARRLPLYAESSCMEAVNTGNDAALALSRQLRTPLGTPVPISPAFFLSLTFPRVQDAWSILDHASAGVDVLELRVDLLHADGQPSIDDVREQVALLRQYTSLPILYTVRSVSQGGRLPDEANEAYFALTRLGLRMGCEYVDIELTRPSDGIEELAQAKGQTRIVASFHDTSGTMHWMAPAMRRLYTRACVLGDIAKLVGFARTWQDSLDLESFRTRVAQEAPFPLIAINMQAAGQLSRIVNPLLTPVTHPALPVPAAPGQMSVRDIHHARHLLGLLPKRHFFLFGTPITHSQSPLIHNTAFELLGLPHVYARHETDSVDASVEALVRADDFGGASVTIPHKLSIMQLLDSVSPDAQVIGAVNTIVPHRDETTGHMALHGENTDWQAIVDLVARHDGGSTRACTALVIGAGGSARAALYAMHKLGASRILLYNRTFEKAVNLAEQVPVEWRVEPVDSLALAAKAKPNVIVSNVPAQGTSFTPGGADIVLPLDLLSSDGGVAIDMAYRPEITPLLTLAQQHHSWHGVRGIEILLAQAFHQFRLWTGLPPPYLDIETTAYAAYRAAAASM